MQLIVPILVPRNRKIAEATFKADIKFKTKAKVTKRTVDVSEAFGIGIDDQHEFRVYDNFSVEINKRDIVYITGDSGSGKSLLLKELAARMILTGEFGRVITDREIQTQIDPEKPIIEQVGHDTSSAVRTLSLAGLNEAFLMLRKHNELSDGQKYRFKLAKLIDSGADTWIMDEFLSLLDRTTAKVVAYTIQKATRRLGKTVIVATTHTDLDEDLNPDVRILKQFGSNVTIDYRKADRNRPCSLLKDIRIEEGCIGDYNELKRFHYRDARIIPKLIYRAVLNDEVMGVIVYGPPHLALRARSLVLPQYRKQKHESWHENALRINRDIIRIWRVVIQPKYRGIGIATLLVKKTMPLTGFPYVETLAVMARYSSFFDEAGMLRVDPELYLGYDIRYESALQRLAALGFDPELLSSKSYNMKVLKRLSKNDLKEVKLIVSTHFIAEKFRKPSVKKSVLDGDLESIARALTGRRLPYVYLVWKNPRFHDKPEPQLSRL